MAKLLKKKLEPGLYYNFGSAGEGVNKAVSLVKSFKSNDSH